MLSQILSMRSKKSIFIQHIINRKKAESQLILLVPVFPVGGGIWRGYKIVGSEVIQIEEVRNSGQSLMVNRMMIQKGEYKQLAYCWFRQRDRLITNEFLVKWYLFLDALTRNRTDGALLRLTTAVSPTEDWKKWGCSVCWCGGSSIGWVFAGLINGAVDGNKRLFFRIKNHPNTINVLN